MSSLRRTILRSRTRWLNTPAGKRWLRDLKREMAARAAARRQMASERSV